MCYSQKSCDAIAQAKHSLESGETELARGSSPHGCGIESWTDQQQEPLESASAPAAFVHACDGSCSRHYAVLEHAGPSSSQRLSTTTKFDQSELLSPFRCNSRGEIIGDVNKVLTRDTHNARPLHVVAHVVVVHLQHRHSISTQKTRWKLERGRTCMLQARNCSDAHRVDRRGETLALAP